MLYLGTHILHFSMVNRPLTIEKNFFQAYQDNQKQRYLKLHQTQQQRNSNHFSQHILANINLNHVACSKSQRSHIGYKKFKWQHWMLFYKSLIYVIDGSTCLRVLGHCHEDYGAGNMVILVPHLHKLVKDYVHKCDACR